MKFMAIILYALVLAIDATTVAITDGFCYGQTMKKRRMWLIAGLFGLFQGLMPLIGYWLFFFLEEHIKWLEAAGTFIAAALLAALAIKMLIEGFRAIYKDEQITCDVNTPRLKKRQVLLQAVATSIDALAVGIGIFVGNTQQIAQTNIWIAALIIALVTTATSLTGVFVGIKIGPFMKKYAPLIGGAVLMVLAFNFLFGFLF